MKNTENYNLKKPESTDFYNVEDMNENMDIIDERMKEIEDVSSESKNNIAEHLLNKDNPHSVTKSQVGLSNVPNVSTNNQTPTYTVPSENTNLESGEKLSIAFGKIAKAISSLISHLANKSNPHSVTKSQVGLGNVNNTSDADKPVSTAQQTALDAKVNFVEGNSITFGTKGGLPFLVFGTSTTSGTGITYWALYVCTWYSGICAQKIAGNVDLTFSFSNKKLTVSGVNQVMFFKSF